MSIEIRKPKSNELGRVRTLRHEELSGDQPVSQEIDPSEADLNPSAIHMAAFDDSTVISAVRADPNQQDPTVYWISRMVTRLEYRNQHWGSKVLKAVETAAVEQGAKRFILAARPTAIKFYEKYGYWNTYIQLQDESVMVKSV